MSKFWETLKPLIPAIELAGNVALMMTGMGAAVVLIILLILYMVLKPKKCTSDADCKSPQVCNAKKVCEKPAAA